MCLLILSIAIMSLLAGSACARLYANVVFLYEPAGRRCQTGRTRLAGKRAPVLERRKPRTSRAKAALEPGSGSGSGSGGGVQICTRDFTYSSIRLLEL